MELKGQPQGVPLQSCSLVRMIILQTRHGWIGQRTSEEDKYESVAHPKRISLSLEMMA